MPPAEFTLEVLRAEHGDCLLLRHGADLVLIDGGPPSVYDEALRPTLDTLAADRDRPLWVRMVMVSHIDDDHIGGLTEMFGEAVERDEEGRGEQAWRVGELWLNAFGALTGAGATAGASEAHAAALQSLVAVAPGGESRAIVAGVANGIALQRDARQLGVDINASVGGALIVAGEDGATTLGVGDGLTLTVLAPSAQRLAKLRETWEEWERDHARAPDAHTAANLDRSVFNLSSIVVLAESGGRRMLLTGDARSDHVLDGLLDAGLLTRDGAALEVDVLKLPHHGSIRNVDARFFERVRARHYVISANGRDGNPEDETLGLLCDARRDAQPWTLWLTYGGAPGDGRPGLHERLTAFLDARRAGGQVVDVRFGQAGATQRIELAAAGAQRSHL